MVTFKKAMILFYEQNNLSAYKQLFIGQFAFAVNGQNGLFPKRGNIPITGRFPINHRPSDREKLSLLVL
jgi:hypothetical protein